MYIGIVRVRATCHPVAGLGRESLASGEDEAKGILSVRVSMHCRFTRIKYTEQVTPGFPVA